MVYSRPNHNSDSALVLFMYGASIRATVEMRGADFRAFAILHKKCIINLGFRLWLLRIVSRANPSQNEVKIDENCFLLAERKEMTYLRALSNSELLMTRI